MTSYRVYKKVCLYCGQPFEAKCYSTACCSKTCSSRYYKQRQRQKSLKEKEEKSAEQNLVAFERQFNGASVMTPPVAAKYLGLGRMTIYRYMREGRIPCLQTPGKTLIRKEDLDKLFENALPYTRKENAVRRSPDKKFTEERKLSTSDIAPGSKYITVKEAAEMYSINPTTILKTLRNDKIKGINFRQTWFFDRDEVDKSIKKRVEFSHPEITEWYTKEEIKEKYGMTDNAVWTLAYEYAIPKRRKGLKMLYSKQHVDAVKAEHKTRSGRKPSAKADAGKSSEKKQKGQNVTSRKPSSKSTAPKSADKPSPKSI